MRKPRVCPKCDRLMILTRHHIKPRRWFGKGRRNNSVIYICRECHDELELLIPYERKKVSFYYEVIKQFGLMEVVEFNRNKRLELQSGSPSGET